MTIATENLWYKLQGLFGLSGSEIDPLSERIVSIPFAALTSTAAVTTPLFGDPSYAWDVVSGAVTLTATKAEDSSNYTTLVVKSKAAGASDNESVLTHANSASTLVDTGLTAFVPKAMTLASSNTRVDAGGCLIAIATAATTESYWGAGVITLKLRRAT